MLTSLFVCVVSCFLGRLKLPQEIIPLSALNGQTFRGSNMKNYCLQYLVRENFPSEFFKSSQWRESLFLIALYHREKKITFLPLTLKGGQKKGYVFLGRFFRPTSNVDILETVCWNDLKFEVRIVLDWVPLQIQF